MYFPDLAPYQYDLPFSIPDVLSVGWLSTGHPFPKGRVREASRVQLEQLTAAAAVHSMRGTHPCPFCDCEAPGLMISDREFLLGSAELWVRDSVGRVFAAPNLVVHYVDAHDYQPPGLFLDALEWTSANIGRWDATTVYELLVARGFAAAAG